MTLIFFFGIDLASFAGRGQTNDKEQKMIKRILAAIVIGGLASMPISEASADVIYRIQQANSGTVNFDATLTLADFVGTPTLFPIADFTVAVGPGPFLDVYIAPGGGTGSSGCGLYGFPGGCDIIELRSAVGRSDYYYALGPLGELGTHSSTLGNFTGTVTVTQTAPVPEPMSLALLGTATFGLAFARRRRDQEQ